MSVNETYLALLYSRPWVHMILLSAERIVPLCYSKKKLKGIKRKKRIEKMSPQYIYLQNLSFSFLGGY